MIERNTTHDFKKEMKMMDKVRCKWAGDLQIYRDYHDYEWGKPVHDDQVLFEMFILETMQAGLSWITILKKRESYREAFDFFDASKIIHYDATKIEELMQNEGIIRNRLKINSVISNAKLYLDIQKKYGSFNDFLWNYVDGKPIMENFKCIEEMPASTPLSDQISKDLKKMGFKFAGSTIVYAFMQAVGMVNAHTTDCFVYKEMQK